MVLVELDDGSSDGQFHSTFVLDPCTQAARAVPLALVHLEILLHIASAVVLVGYVAKFLAT